MKEVKTGTLEHRSMIDYFVYGEAMSEELLNEQMIIAMLEEAYEAPSPPPHHTPKARDRGDMPAYVGLRRNK